MARRAAPSTARPDAQHARQPVTARTNRAGRLRPRHARTPLHHDRPPPVRHVVSTDPQRWRAQLPPAAELAEALSVDRNTVLAAYRQLRDGGVLEFRRGRGVRVARAAPSAPAVVGAATDLIDLARTHGMGRDDLIRLIQELT